jgi:Fur family ferric uptake transcriptional regulator
MSVDSDDCLHKSRQMPRLTRQQRTVLEVLQQLAQPISAQSLYKTLRQDHRSIGLATVYRSLEVLKLQGLVQSRINRQGESLYSLVQQDQHYLTCLKCGQSTPLDSCPVKHLERQLQQSASFTIYYHSLEFFGLCQPCALLD